MLTTILFRSKIDGKTIPLVLAGSKLKAKAKTNPLDSESWQKLADQTTIAGDRLQENLLKSVFVGFVTQM